MKSSSKKAKSKTHSKSKSHKKTRTKTHSKREAATHFTEPETMPSPGLTLNTSLKTCQEIEVGDIGGFGSPEELEEHQKRCNEPATEFCDSCGRNLCRNHYDMLHRDHDRTSGLPSSSSQA